MRISNSKYGFTFNGHHSSEFGLKVMSDKSFTLPSKNKVTVQLPYTSGLQDLSSLYGDISLGERTITFPCRLPCGINNYMRLQASLRNIQNWLMNTTGKVKLVDDIEPSFYYLGEVETGPTVTSNAIFTTITITFNCYAYKLYEVNRSDLWDPFDFEYSIAQIFEYDVDGSKQLDLINGGETIAPLIIDADSTFKIDIGGQQFDVSKGKDVYNEIELKPGANHLFLQGTGHVSFDWYEEVI